MASRVNGAWNCSTGGSGTGDVAGPASSTANAAARFSNTGGKVLKDSPVIIEDAGNLVVNPSGTGSIFLSGPSSSGNTTKITSANLGILNITGYNGATRVRADGGFEPGGFSDTAFLGINRGLDLAGNRVVAWTSATGVNAVNPSSPSAGLCLSAAGVVGVNDGSLTCSNTRDLKVRGVQHATGTRPTCDSTTRGTTWYVAGGAGG